MAQTFRIGIIIKCLCLLICHTVRKWCKTTVTLVAYAIYEYSQSRPQFYTLYNGSEQQRQPAYLMPPNESHLCLWRVELSRLGGLPYLLNPHSATDRQILFMQGALLLSCVSRG